MKGFAAALFILTAGLSGCSLEQHKAEAKQIETKSSTVTAKKTSNNPSNSVKAAPPNWNKPSGGPYPTLTANEPIWIDVSIKKQRVYIMDNQKVIYTMVTSSGIDTTPDTTTPTGTYHIQAERGTWFYSPKYKEGAEYWVSWKNHGEFLFHSVPMTQDKKVIPKDAEKLGQKDSHGCFHLTIPDAKWIYDNIPYGTKVVVHN
ncbi:L,D-transpeptidase [Heyndrickxia acidicola]